MRFGVLGPPEVRTDTGSIQLAPKARALLAALLTRPNRTIPIWRLIDAIWCDAPPSAAASLRVYVHQLRRALGDTDRIMRTTTGLGLVVRDGELDAGEFETLAEAGRAAIADGRPTDGGRLLADALGHWRGPAFAGLEDLPLVREEAARLNELRQVALADRIDVELSLGRHGAIIAELTALVEEHPYAERLRGQLMLALYRVGRPADALAVFRDGRRLLTEMVGTEPGADLRRLELAILANDPALEVSTVQASPRPSAVPRELPPDLATFTGRAAESAWISQALRCDSPAQPGPVMAAIVGPGGVGKSTLAVRVAHQIADRFPDGQLYVDLHGSTAAVKALEPAEALAAFLRSLGQHVDGGPDESAFAARFRALTEGRRLLVVLDNAADAAQVRPLLPHAPGSAVLITGRRPLTALEGVAHHQLDALKPDEAVALLARIVGPDRLAAESADADEVVRLCGRLPLAIGIAAARLVARPRWSIRHLVDRLAQQNRRLTELAVDDRSVRASFAVSYTDLVAPAAARMFRLLGLLDGAEVGLPVAAALADVPESQARELLDELVDAQLVTVASPSRYRLHDLLRLFARERAEADESADDRAEARLGVLHCFIASAGAAVRAIQPTYGWRLRVAPVDRPRSAGVPLNSGEQVSGWLEAERENLSQAFRQAATGDDPALAISLAAGLDVVLEYRGRWQDQLRLAELTVDAARRTGADSHLALATNDLGWALLTVGRVAESERALAEAVRAWRRGEHRDGEAVSLQGLGAAYRVLGRTEDSLAALREATAIARESGNLARAGACATGIGLTHQVNGAYQDAIEAHTEGTDLARAGDAWLTEAMALGNLAEAYRLDGRPTRAVEVFQQALEVGRAADYQGTYWEAEHLWGLGRARRDQDLDGTGCWRAAARILGDLGLIPPAERARIEGSDDPEIPTIIAGHLT